MSAPAPRAAKGRVLDTSATDPKTIPNQNLHAPPYASPISDSDLNFESGSDIYSDSYSDSYSDPDTEPDICTDPNIGLELESDTDLDSEAKEILKDIAQLEEEGPAKPRHEPQTIKLWKREGEIWAKFCLKIKADPKDALRKCSRGKFKAYLC